MRKEQRGIANRGFALFMVIIAFSAIHGQDVMANYMPETDFSKYHTYKWLTIGEGGHPDQILDAQIRQAVDSQLADKGFTKVEGDNPDLLVAYRVGITEETDPWPHGSTATRSTIHVGTLILGMFDPGARQLIWRASVSKTIDDSKDPEQIQKNLNKAVENLLKNFPPGRK